MNIENHMQSIRLTMLVMLLIEDERHNNIPKKTRKKYEKAYLEITGETWEETKKLYLANLE